MFVDLIVLLLEYRYFLAEMDGESLNRFVVKKLRKVVTGR
jgi:hypothetical protein